MTTTSKRRKRDVPEPSPRNQGNNLRLADPCDPSYTAKEVIAPLRWFLMESCTIDQLLSLLDKLHLRYTICGNEAHGHRGKVIHRMHIMRMNEIEYNASSSVGLKPVIADCLAKFLANERVDIHEFQDIYRPWMDRQDDGEKK